MWLDTKLQVKQIGCILLGVEVMQLIIRPHMLTHWLLILNAEKKCCSKPLLQTESDITEVFQSPWDQAQ